MNFKVAKSNHYPSTSKSTPNSVPKLHIYTYFK